MLYHPKTIWKQLMKDQTVNVAPLSDNFAHLVMSQHRHLNDEEFLRASSIFFEEPLKRPMVKEELYCNLCKKVVTDHNHSSECQCLNGFYAVRHNAVQNEVTLAIKIELRPTASNCASQ